jgi:hypothetical protein
MSLPESLKRPVMCCCLTLSLLKFVDKNLAFVSNFVRLQTDSVSPFPLFLRMPSWCLLAA